MLIDIHSHQASEHTSELLRIGAYAPSREVPLNINTAFTYGLHPCFAEDITPQGLERLEIHLKESLHLWGIGEAGLDKLSPIPWNEQIAYFIKQIELSEAFQKPLVIHCVRAWGELLQLHRALRPRQPWVIHGFRKAPALACQLMERGLYLSFGAHWHADSLQLALRERKLLIETDESPLALAEIYTRIANALGLTLNQLEPLVEEIFLSLGKRNAQP